MSNATTLLEQLIDEDVDWMLANEERHVGVGEMSFVERGTPTSTVAALEAVVANCVSRVYGS